jgi:hypothetical protein
MAIVPVVDFLGLREAHDSAVAVPVGGPHLPDAHAGDGSGDDQALDFGGAFEDGVDLFQRRGDWRATGVIGL